MARLKHNLEPMSYTEYKRMEDTKNAPKDLKWKKRAWRIKYALERTATTLKPSYNVAMHIMENAANSQQVSMRAPVRRRYRRHKR